MWSVDDTVYESDPRAASDDDFVVGCPLYAVAGNHGRLRDARRTPLSITAVEPERGEIEVRIDAFEDRGQNGDFLSGRSTGSSLRLAASMRRAMSSLRSVGQSSDTTARCG